MTSKLAKPAVPNTKGKEWRGRVHKATWPPQSYLELGALPGAVPSARLHTRLVVCEWGLQELAESAELIISELVTNAVDASIVLPERPPIALRLLVGETSLIIEVWDHSPLELEVREADADAECGRGLTVVAALSDRWGWERIGYRRKVVWSELVTRGSAGG